MQRNAVVKVQRYASMRKKLNKHELKRKRLMRQAGLSHELIVLRSIVRENVRMESLDKISKKNMRLYW